jgi:hypothetical protein
VCIIQIISVYLGGRNHWKQRTTTINTQSNIILFDKNIQCVYEYKAMLCIANSSSIVMRERPLHMHTNIVIVSPLFLFIPFYSHSSDSFQYSSSTANQSHGISHYMYFSYYWYSKSVMNIYFASIQTESGIHELCTLPINMKLNLQRANVSSIPKMVRAIKSVGLSYYSFTTACLYKNLEWFVEIL